MVSVARLPADGARYEIVANAAERAALARRFDLVALDRLEADIRLRAVAGGIRLEARLEAAVVQECVVLLENFLSEVTEEFSLLYRADEEEREVELSPEEDIEILSGEEIDIGEAVAQQLSLVLDPHPRAPDLEAREADAREAGADASPPSGPGEAAERVNPFAKLAALRPKAGGDKK